MFNFAVRITTTIKQMELQTDIDSHPKGFFLEKF